MEEREERYFDVRGIILKVLFLLLFVFLLLWLAPFPKMDQVYDSLFNENLENMKEAAKSFYTNERLPKEIGEKRSMSLKEMLDQKLLVSFLDSDGKSCRLNTSYVEVTKMENEYILKVYLDCESKQDYILEHIGCYDYCNGLICEEESEEDEKKTSQVTSYLMQIKSKTSGWSDWGNWEFENLLETSNREKEERIVYTAKKWVETNYKKYQYQTTVVTTKYELYSAWKTGSETINACASNSLNRTATGYPKPTYTNKTTLAPRDTTLASNSTNRYTLIKTVPNTVTTYPNETTLAPRDTILASNSTYRYTLIKTVPITVTINECDWNRPAQKITVTGSGGPGNYACYKVHSVSGLETTYQIYYKKRVTTNWYTYTRETIKKTTTNWYTYMSETIGKVYKCENRTYTPPSTTTTGNTIWTTNPGLFAGKVQKTITNGRKVTTTKYIGKPVEVSNEDGEWIEEAPIKHYEAITDLPSGYEVSRKISQYKYRTKTFSSKTKTEWISSNKYRSYLNAGWEKIDEKTITVTL